MTWLSAWFLAAFLQVASAKAVGLPGHFACLGLHGSSKAGDLCFQFGQVGLKFPDDEVTLAATRTGRNGSGHDQAQRVSWG